MTATLEKYDVVTLGLDRFFAFKFTFTDDRILEQLVKEWDLRKRDDTSYELTSFVHFKAPDWWPSEKLQQFGERYDRVIGEDELFWSVWVDRQNKNLYAEYGKW